MLLKTFARRNGRSLSVQKKNLLNSFLPDLIFNPDNIESYFNYKEVILEIGFGMGDHFIHQIQTQPNKFYIGAEVYLPGVANVLNFAHNKNIANLAIWPDSIDLIIEHIPDNSLNSIFILFPDPWPKRRQRKKRLLNPLRLNLFVNKLKHMGEIIFASDIEDYVINTKMLMENHNKLFVTSTNIVNKVVVGDAKGRESTTDCRRADAEDNIVVFSNITNAKIFNYNLTNYVPTKYHKIAISEGRSATFLIATKSIK